MKTTDYRQNEIYSMNLGSNTVNSIKQAEAVKIIYCIAFSDQPYKNKGNHTDKALFFRFPSLRAEEISLARLRVLTLEKLEQFENNPELKNWQQLVKNRLTLIEKQ